MECPICFYNWNKETTVPVILSCGHSICMQCSKRLFSSSQITCSTCFAPTAFTIERQHSESDTIYINKCIESLKVNYTLLMLVPVRPSQKSQSRDFKYGMRCKKHNLIIHSYVVKPYSMLCDNCLEEIEGMNLEVMPFSEVLDICRETMGQIKNNLETLKANTAKIEDEPEEEKALRKDVEHHFFEVSISIRDAETQAINKLSEKLKAFKEDASLQYKNIEKTVNKVKICEQRLAYLSTLSLSQLIQEKKTIDTLLIASMEHATQVDLPALVINFEPKLDSGNVFSEFLKNSMSIKVSKMVKEMWNCRGCNKKVNTRKVQCRCGKFRPLETYPNLENNVFACTEAEISEVQQRREIEMNLINQLDTTEENGVWYIINAEWVNCWKSFVFNKPIRTGINLPAVGVLPPSFINNHALLKEHGEPKAKLKPVVHYRGVNKKVWEAYIHIYGGGPPIIRNKINIYE